MKAYNLANGNIRQIVNGMGASAEYSYVERLLGALPSVLATKVVMLSEVDLRDPLKLKYDKLRKHILNK
jgi:hypothetical protein